MTSTAEAVLIAHQRHRGGCLCGWSELGKSHPAHQVQMLAEAATNRTTPEADVVQTFRKTATVQAMRWDPDQPTPVLSWLAEARCYYRVLDNGRLGVGTLESGDDVDRHAGKPGDWVLRGAAGEFYICDVTVFAETYEPVTT